MELLSSVATSHTGFDRRSSEHLVELFKRTVGDQEEITKENFQRIYVSKNPFFTERVFQIFDEDDSGSISLQEFIAAVHQFAGKTPEDKLRFLFRVYDLDGDGLIQHGELQHVMRACMGENGMQFSDEQLLELTSAMFEDADTENTGAITYEALKAQLKRHEGLLENLTITIDRWLVPPKPDPEPTSCLRNLAKLKPHQLSLPYIKNNYVLVIYMALFSLVNIGLFVWQCLEYSDSNGFVILARATGLCLNFNCAMELVLMLRKCITQLRVRGFSTVLPLDQHIQLHKITGVLILILSVIHVVMHLCNFSIMVVNDPIVNKDNHTLYEWLLTDRPGLFGLVGGCANPTGVALVAILVVMLISSHPAIRKWSFEVFHWVHWLHVPFWVLLIFHSPNFYFWFILPGSIYVVERILRLSRRRSERGRSYVVSGTLLPSRVTHISIKRPEHFRFHAGDYIFLNIPAIAEYEWHPFTISSAPENNDYIWLHIRGVGEWTNRLYSYFEMQRARLQADEVPPRQAGGGVGGAEFNLARTSSNQTDKSKRRRSVANSKKRCVGFLPESYSIGEYKRRGEITFTVTPRDACAATLSTSSGDDIHYLNASSSMPDLRMIEDFKINCLKIQGRRQYQSNSEFTENSLWDLKQVKDSKARRAHLRVSRVQNWNCQPGSSIDSIDTFIAAPSPPDQNLNRSRSMPDLRAHEDIANMRQRLLTLRYDVRPNAENISAQCQTADLGPMSFHSRELAHNSRYTRREPTIIALETPQLEEPERDGNESVLTAARRLLSNTLSPYKDLESQRRRKSKRLNVTYCVRRSHCSTDVYFSNNPVGKPLKVYLDGPYGAASSHIFRAQHAVLIAAGIGVTPFASILQSIMYRYWSTRNVCPKCDHTWASTHPLDTMTLRKVDFMWINRDQVSFEWFLSLLSELEMEQAEYRLPEERFLDIHLYITSALKSSDMKAVGLQLALDLLHQKEKRDLITGLKTRTKAGRPNWDQVFQQLQEQRKGKVTVFYCGPPQLARDLRLKCEQYNFNFRKEVF